MSDPPKSSPSIPIVSAYESIFPFAISALAKAY
jgi:hypothetical protein